MVDSLRQVYIAKNIDTIRVQLAVSTSRACYQLNQYIYISFKILLLFQFFVFSLYVSLRSEFRVVMSITISAYKRYSVRLYRQLFLGGFMSYLRYLCLFAYSGFVFLRLVKPMLSVSLNCPFLIATSVFSNVYLCSSTKY